MEQNKKIILICVILAGAVAWVYWPVFKYDFVSYDDDVYVMNNQAVKVGINLQTIKWAFTSGYASNWHPLTWLSHMLDYQMFKSWAGGHHLVNILFHIANTILLFYFLKKALSLLWPSVFIAAAFALHPLHVESVAWIAERKDLLSTFFWMLTMIAYITYAKNIGQKKYYWLALLFFVFGLLAKPMVVTLPFVLLLLDYWPLERKFNKRLLTEKIPFFILSAASCVVTYLVQQRGGAITNVEAYGLKTRAANIIISYADYILKMVWPSKLMVLYPFSPSSFTPLKILISAAILLAITFIVIWFGRRYKFLTFGWLWYLGTLVPVIGFIQIGAHSMADRYTYIPLIGIFLMIAFGARELLREPLAARKPEIASASQFANRSKGLLPVDFGSRTKILNIWGQVAMTIKYVLVVILICWGVVSANQVKYWQNSLTLFKHALNSKESFIIMSNYAASLNEAGRYEEALEYGNEALKAKPDSPENHNTVGNSLCKLGKYDEAIEHYKLAIQYKPKFPEAYLNLGIAVKNFNNLEAASQLFEKAIEYRPEYKDAYLELSMVLIDMQRFQEAVDVCNRGLKIEPDNVFLRGRLGMALSGVGRIDEAIEQIKYVLSVRPGDSQMYRNLGILLSQKGLHVDAIEAYKKSLQIEPNDTNVKWLLERSMKESNGQQK
jgi:tetratricopeptide (TPR) repeat protein